MKKLALYILAVVAGIAAVSCAREELVTYDSSEAIPPVINSFLVDEDGNLSVTFTPGNLGMTFNEKMPVNHSLVLLKADGKEASRVLTSSVDGNVITTSAKALSRGLATLGYVDGDVVKEVEISLRASLQEQSKDNGINGFVESLERVNLKDVLVILPQDSPYKEYEKLSAWTVIGSIAAYEMSWDKDLSMWTDGNHNHVAAHVNLAKGDEFKFRKDLDWAENFGGEFAGLDSEFDIAQDGSNIKVDADGVYDLYFNDDTKKAWISEAFDPYPAFTQSSTWSIIGALSQYKDKDGNAWSWNNDIAMVSDGTSHLALNVALGKDDEWKFRKDADWGVNFGGEFGGLGNEFSVTQDGPNIKVNAEGNFDMLLNPDAGTASVSEACGARVSYIILPEEEPVPEEKGWGIVGDFNGWGDDVEMTEENGIWTAYFTNANKEDGSNGAFKFRKNLAWDENYGAPGDAEPVAIKLGEAMALAAGGKNFSAPAGMYHVTLDLTKEDAPTATFVSADVFSLIGKINGSSWDKDFEMAAENGVYTSDVVFIDGGFKIRHNFSWADEDTYGAEKDAEIVVGTAFTAVQPGSDISLPAGNYKVKFTLATKEILITSVDYELPEIDLSKYEEIPAMAGANTWGLIGPAQPGGWDTDTDLQKIQDEPEIWAVMNVALQANKFKFRGNDEWADYDLGGGASFELDTPIVMSVKGGDMSAELGVYTIFLYPTYGLLYITEGTGDVPEPPAKPEMWSLIGTLDGSSWDKDFDMTNTSGDLWVIKDVAVTASDEFKIRADHSWDTNVGGPEENSTSTIDSTNPYGVYKPVLGEAFAAGDKNIQIGVAGNYDVYFDAEKNTITILEAGAFPDNSWGLVGTINGWGNTFDTPLLEDGLFLSAKNVALTADDEIKIRFNQSWDDNRGGLSVVGVPVKAVPGGDNIKPGVAGNYDVYYRPDSEVIIVAKAGEALEYWGVVGTINGWAAPDKLMYQNADGLLESSEIELAATDEIKIRKNEDWDVNRGGTFAELDKAFEVTNGGPNIALGRDAKVQVLYNASAETITIKGQFTGDAPAFPDDIYAIGADTGWSGMYKLHGDNGKYKGFGYLSDEFKFKPNADNWDGNWGAGSEAGQIALGGGNIAGPATAGYYMIDVDLSAMTYTLTLISTIGIIGPAQAGGWDSDTDMTFNKEAGCWELSGVTLSAGDMKFRANDGWDINWGGSLDALTQGGANIAVQAGTYDVKLFALCDGEAYATLTEAAAPSSPTLYLNEFDTKNKKMEIYNPNDTDVDMTGWKVIKDDGQEDKDIFTIPAALAKVPAKGYAVFTCKQSDAANGPLFGLSGTKGFKIALMNGTTAVDVVDNLTSITQIPDGKSWGRETDGAATFVIFDTPTIGAANGVAAIQITIDGDMSDWANVEGLTASSETAAHKEFKVAFDETYLYFYTKTNNNNGNMWANGRYMYFNFDLDNNPDTGFTHDSVAGLEAYIYIYMYGGTSDSQAINATPSGKIAIETDNTSSYTCETNSCAGVITSEIVETEVKIARSDFGIKKGDTIRINSWGNKSASDLKSQFITVTIDK